MRQEALRGSRTDALPVQRTQQLKVAVLLATCNGAQFVDVQLHSLKNNRTPFCLHWLDDHSEDGTRDIVRASAMKANIDLKEWHQNSKQGWPGTYFQLLESVEADIYLFCDQDDIWQPGKIDATVENLAADLQSPNLCFSDALVFDNKSPSIQHRLTEILRFTASESVEGYRSFVFAFSFGHTVGFTRALRDIVLKHIQIARTYAAGHDMWLYLIAYAIGTIKFLDGAPTTLYRIHSTNLVGHWVTCLQRKGFRSVLGKWQFVQKHRPPISKQAFGFVQAADLLPRHPNLDQMLSIAKCLSHFDRRQTPLRLLKLMRLGCLPPRFDLAAMYLAACLVSSAASR